MLRTLLVLVAFTAPVFAEDWPTRLHDVHRSGITSETLGFPLDPEWTHTAKTPPAPAWTESPALHNYLHKTYDLKPRQHFDRCFDVAVVGSRVYFGSSTTGVVTCLDADAGGRVLWTFFTGGPVRFAPHVVNDRAYAGSDDGFVYCINAADGSLIWSERAGPSEEMVWGNQQMISLFPVRGSVMVDGDDVFWTAGIFPEEGMFVCKRNAVDGTGGWTATAKAPPQGYLLALPDRIFVPTGKSFPRIYSRGDGACVGQLMSENRDGGTWALITPDEREFWFGPTVRNETQSFNINTGARIAMVREANALVADAAHAYYTTDTRIIKMDRSAKSVVWSREHPGPYAIIKAGQALIVGGDREVAAFNAEGEVMWEHAVDGKVYGLAVANARLYVSTDTGSIQCFRAILPSIRHVEQASDVTPTSATVKAELVSQGAASPTVSVFWGTRDGLDDESGWEHRQTLGETVVGPVQAILSELKANRTYFYRFRATNSHGAAWAESSGAFITGAVSLRSSGDPAIEGSGNGAEFAITRPRGTTGCPLPVRFTVSGTAEPGTDYPAISGEALIEQGARKATIAIAAHDDLVLNEPDETVVASLRPGPYVIGEPSIATVRIREGAGVAGWRYRMRIVFGGYEGTDALEDFPALIALDESLPGFRYDQFGAPNGADLRFTDGDGVALLAYELEEWNPEGRSYVWVRVPKLSGAETAILAYWGNAGATAPAYSKDGTTWSGGYDGVWHLGDAESVLDATAAQNLGTPQSGLSQTVSGVVGSALEFDGHDDAASLTTHLGVGSSSNTVSAWIKVPKVGSGGLADGERVGILLGNCPSGPGANWELHSKGQLRFWWDSGKTDGYGTTDLRDDTWHHVAWVRDKEAGTCFMYIDGSLEETIKAPGADISFTSIHHIGGDNRGAKAPNFHGVIDELRVSTVARSAPWLAACSKNQSSPDDFIHCGPVEDLQSR